MSTPNSLPFVNPATEEQFGEVTISRPLDAKIALAEMRLAGQEWSLKSTSERLWHLNGFKEVLIDRADEIATILNQDCGKTKQDGLVEVFITVDTLNQFVRHGSDWLKRKTISPGLYFFKRYYQEMVPYGVVAVIGPWNYPLVQVLTPVLAALAAGNTVVIKPSEVTPAVGHLIERLFAEFPSLAPYVRVLHGGPEVGAALVDAPPDLIFVTGSGPTARKILTASAPHLTPVITELGGKDAMIVLEDANIQQAAKWGVWASNYHSGQVCMSVERIYVVDAVYDEFVAAAQAEIADFKIGYTVDENSPYHCGPITFSKQVDVIEGHLQDALDKGARIVMGGRRRKMFFEPTLLVDVNHDMDVMRSETFGPVMPIMKVRDEAEAIRLANDSEYGLCASVWSRNLSRAEAVGRQLQVGTVVVNDAMSNYAVSQLPFGGVKKSGSGRIHGEQEVLQFAQTKAYAVGPAPLPFDVATIFRGPGHYHNMKRLLKLAFGTRKQRIEAIWPALADFEAQQTDNDNGTAPPKDGHRGAVWSGLAAALFGIVVFAIARRTQGN